MPSKNFRQDRNKYREGNQHDIYNPEFASSINVMSTEELEKFQSTLDKSYYIASYFRWY